MPKREKPPLKPEQTPFERFEDFVRRIVRIPKSEIPKQQWSRAQPKSDR